MNEHTPEELQQELATYGLEVSREQAEQYIKGLIGDDPLTDYAYQQVLESAMLENNLALNIDWKWNSTDLLQYDIKNCIPDLTFTNEYEPYIEETDHNFKGKIWDKDVDIKSTDGSPNALIEAVNEIIREKISKEFVEMPVEGDYYLFLLVSSDKIDSIREKYPLEGN